MILRASALAAVRTRRLARPLSSTAHLLQVGQLDLVFEASRWVFAERQATSIAANWARLREAKPSLFNGRVLLLGRRAIQTRFDGALTLKGVYFETDYADYVAWQEFGFPGEPVENCFSMAALRGADGAFLLGEMAPHTFTAGQIYFPAGTPDPTDVFDGRVDLEASARRELFEETGVSADETEIAPGWTLGLHAPANRLHEADDARGSCRARQGADRRSSRARPSRRVFAHAHRAQSARHRQVASAGIRRRVPPRSVRSRIGRIAVSPLRGGDHGLSSVKPASTHLRHPRRSSEGREKPSDDM